MNRLARFQTRFVADYRRALAVLGVPALGGPDFLIIGAQKAGTSSLYAWLTQHPDVLAARRKELHYFTRFDDGDPIERYLRDFPTKPTRAALARVHSRDVRTGEATPFYLVHPLVPARVNRHFPRVKLIAILRDPAERAISHYWMTANRGRDPLSLAEALRSEATRLESDLTRLERGARPSARFQEWSYLTRGRYAEQLERWMAVFPREQLLIECFEDLAADPRRVYTACLEHIGVDPDATPAPQFHAHRVGSKAPTDRTTREWLRNYFYEPNERLRQLAGIDYNR